jgi:hypothetical protein
MDEREAENVYRLLFNRGLLPTGPRNGVRDQTDDAIDASEYPELAAIWDNDDDAIFDDL